MTVTLPTGWVAPHRLDDVPTQVGNAGSPWRAAVDRRGLVTPWDGGWSLDWWVGADDRWHLPSREVAVRQRLIDGAPVVETRLRVPGGDMVQRVYAVRLSSSAGVGELVIVEVANATPVPVALALAVRPYHPRGPARIERIAIEGGTTVSIDGRVGLLLSRPPARMAGSTLRQGDSAAIVLSGGAGSSLPEGLRCDAGQASAAFVFPLPHTATLRVALPLDPGAAPVPHQPPRRAFPAAVPTAEAVARGWRAHADRGPRLALPDERLLSSVETARRFLLLAADGPDALASVPALSRYGYAPEAASALRRCFEEDDVAAIGGLAEHWALHRDRSLVEALAPAVAAAAERIARRRQPSGALVDAGELLAAAGEPRAADAARRAAARMAPGDPSVQPRRQVLASGLHRTGGGVEILSSVRDLLVREADDGGLVLCSPFPESWRGGALEVLGAPTLAGVVSYAVRWHAARPALLWELHRHEGTDPVCITAPGLDPGWASTSDSGEVLLGPVPA